MRQDGTRKHALHSSVAHFSTRSSGTLIAGSTLRGITFFNVASLIGIVVTAALLAMLYREVAISGLLQIRKQDSIRMTRSELNSMSRPVSDFLEIANERTAGKPSHNDFPPALRTAVNGLLLDPSILRVKIYNAKGIVVFSTLPDQIGGDQSANPGFVSALHGDPATELVYRDSFNSFERETENDNLLQTYIPVRRDASSPVLGVFEIYSDVNPLVRTVERTAIKLLGGGLALMMILYAGLVLMVHYGRRVIEAQQQTIRERTATLELLTSQILTSHETEKRKLSDDLHEGVAQTLAAIKLSVEATLRSAADTTQPPQHLHQAVHAIQVAIQEVRSIAMDLHPPVLDDFGLYSALEWVCGEFEALRPDILVERHLQMDERAIPAPLVIIIYRVAADALRTFVMNARTTRVSLGLRKKADVIILTMEEKLNGSVDMSEEDSELAEPMIATIRQLTLLSGGALTVNANASGGRTLQSEWMV